MLLWQYQLQKRKVMNNKVYQIAIIGGGAGGIMASLRGALNNNEVILFPGTPKNKKKSRALWVSKVENMPGYLDFKKGIVDSHNQTLEQLKGYDNFQTVPNEGIKSISKDTEGLFELIDSKDNKYKAQYVVLATGVMDVQPEIEGSIKPALPYANVQLIDYCLRCDGHHVKGKKTSIIGHGVGAAWVAIMLHEKYGTEIDILANGEKTEFTETENKLLDLYNIKVYTNKIQSIQGNARENKLESFTLDDGTAIQADISFISLGMIVYNELAKAIGAELDKRGFVVTNNKGETTVENLYAIGDLRAETKKQIYTAWDTAVDSLDDINAKIRKYKRELLLSQMQLTEVTC
jgi:thioredoxin reductase (NADPH)